MRKKNKQLGRFGPLHDRIDVVHEHAPAVPVVALSATRGGKGGSGVALDPRAGVVHLSDAYCGNTASYGRICRLTWRSALAGGGWRSEGGPGGAVERALYNLIKKAFHSGELALQASENAAL